MLHNLFHMHTILTKTDWDQIVLCSNRFTGKIKRGTWYYKEHRLDLTHIDLGELFAFTDPVAAAHWVAWENSK